MSFNPLMASLTAGVGSLLPAAPTVVELGNQTFNVDPRALKRVLATLPPEREAARKEIAALGALPEEQRRSATARFFRAVGFASYTAIDINDRYGSLIMDLNEPLDTRYGFTEHFDLVTNNGTGEHIFDQHAVFYNMHNLAAGNAVMLHVAPFVEYINHGFYSFHPNLYYALAKANGYQLLAMGVAARSGEGVLATPDDDPGNAPRLFIEQRHAPLRTFLVDSKPYRGGPLGALTGALKHLLRPTDGSRFNRTLRDLQRVRPKLNLVTLLRKVNDAPFRKPIQLRYQDDFGDTALRSEYTP